MREILFRGKRLEIGDFVEGSLIVYPDGDCYIARPSGDPNVLDKFIVDPDTIGQYTGLKDKDGRRIFEGDILGIKFFPQYVERISWEGPPDAIATVFWDLNAFSLQAKNGIDFRYADFCDINYDHTKIIGNIHENPELLEVKDGN